MALASELADIARHSQRNRVYQGTTAALYTRSIQTGRVLWSIQEGLQHKRRPRKATMMWLQFLSIHEEVFVKGL